MLYQTWKEMAKKWRNPDVLVINGDLIEGTQPKDRITTCWSRDLNDQMEDSKRLIRMFNAKRIYIIRGTPYHTQTLGYDVEELIGKDLNAIQENGKYSSEIKLINFAPPDAPERIFQIAHHTMGGKSFHYRGMPSSREMGNVMLAESDWVDKRFRKVFGIARAHVHWYWYSESPSRVMLINPCWQLMTPYGAKFNPTSPPNIGATRFTFNSDGHFEKENTFLEFNMRPTVHEPNPHIEELIKNAEQIFS